MSPKYNNTAPDVSTIQHVDATFQQVNAILQQVNAILQQVNAILQQVNAILQQVDTLRRLVICFAVHINMRHRSLCETFYFC